jgi:ketosteroid isomerase-like protein
VATGDVFDGEQAVRAYFAETRRAFPDQRNELVALHHADDAVIVEFELVGTHLGPLRALPPTGRAFRCRMSSPFVFDGDWLVRERVYGGILRGKEGGRQFAAKHAETDGRKRAVALSALEARTPDRFLATLVMTSREIATDEVLYSMDVGSVIEVRDRQIARHEVFPSPEEAAAAV